MHDLLIENGHLIDPAQNIDAIRSLAIQDGIIAALDKDLSHVEARKVLDATGKYISAGFIDIHCHPTQGYNWLGVEADAYGLDCGVTLMCDAGSAGWATFEAMKGLVLETAQTEIFCFLNISKTGLMTMPEIQSLHDIDMVQAAQTIRRYRPLIKGVKIRVTEALMNGPGIEAVRMAKALAAEFDAPLMMHIGESRKRRPHEELDDFSREAVNFLERGDILSHFLTWEPGGMFTPDGAVYSELESARKRGVVLDACHGLNHFSFSIARRAIKMGLLPDIISTDMAKPGVWAVQSLPVVMSKFLNLGLTIQQTIEMTTINPSKCIEEDKRLGSLAVGTDADITVFELVNGAFSFCDGTNQEKMDGNVLIEPRIVIKKGIQRPAYSNYSVPQPC